MTSPRASSRRTAIKVAAVLLLAAALSGTVQPAEAASCSSLKAIEPELDLAVNMPKQPEIRSAPANEIARRSQEAGSTAAGPPAVTRGVTLTKLAVRTSYTLAERTFPDGRRCAALKHIEARLGYDGITVLIDRRYDKGTCQYRTILEHELEHVRINKDAVRVHEDAFRRGLQQLLRRWEGRWVPAGDAKQLDRELNKVVSDAMEQIRASARRRNARIDTPESYAAVQERCDSW